MSQSSDPSWVLDPDDPRAPPQEIWDRMSPEQRSRLLDELPSEFEPSEASPPEGDYHAEPVYGSREVLRGHFRRMRRRIYIGTDLPTYYPGERVFAPDVLAVLDVEDHPRNYWMVSEEGKGLDFVMEVHWRGRPRKDFETNVARYASLGIREYFVFDVRRLRIRAMRLADEAPRAYRPVMPQGGLYASEVLGLQLGIDGGKLRYYLDTAPLPYAEELIERLNAVSDELAARAEQEAARAEQAEARLQEALAEIERLKRRDR